MGKKVDLFRHYSEHFYRLIRFDRIRVLKLLEMSQFVVLGVIFGILNGLFISNYILIKFEKSEYINDKYDRKVWNRNPKLYLHILWDIIVITITTYYLKKIAQVIPFLFAFISDEYVPDKKGEGLTGFTIGIGFVYLRILTNFPKRLDLMIGNII